MLKINFTTPVPNYQIKPLIHSFQALGFAYDREFNTGEYKDYTFTFKAPADKVRLNFYRLGNKNLPCGIEIAKVILFEGK